MEKIHCNIIKDLLPSYVDKITSEESNEIIQQHLQECDSCKETYDTLKSYAIVADRADHRMAHFLKKKRREKLVENGILLLTVLFLSSIQFYYNFLYSGGVLPSLYVINCILYPGYSVLLTTALSAWKKHSSTQGKQKLILWGEGLGILYISILFYSVLWAINKGTPLPFGLTPHQTGPFLVNQFLLLAAIYICILLVYFLWQKPPKTYYFNVVMMSIAGVTTALNARACLYQMDASSIPIIKSFSITLVAVIAESIVLKIFYQKVYRTPNSHYYPQSAEQEE